MSYPTRLPAKDEMTLRDWFAGQAMSIAYQTYNLLPSSLTEGQDGSEMIALFSYQIADTMLKEREK